MKNLYDSLELGIQERFRRIKLVATDFDGVWTDNLVIQDQNGNEAVRRSRSDSLAIDLLKDAGLYDKGNYTSTQGLNGDSLDIIIMSRETNPVVSAVSKKISVKCQQSKYDKLKAFKEELKSRNLDYSRVAFVGNDLNDIECLNIAKDKGLAIAVADSYAQVLQSANYITARKGGDGAVR